MPSGIKVGENLDYHWKMRVYWIENFTMQQTTYEPVKNLFQGFLTWKDLGTLLTQGTEFNVPILTGCGCISLHPIQPKVRLARERVFLQVRRRPEWPYISISELLVISNSKMFHCVFCERGSTYIFLNWIHVLVAWFLFDNSCLIVMKKHAASL